MKNCFKDWSQSTLPLALLALLSPAYTHVFTLSSVVIMLPLYLNQLLHFSENCFNIDIKGDKDDIQNGRDCMPFIRSKAKFPDCTPSKIHEISNNVAF